MRTSCKRWLDDSCHASHDRDMRILEFTRFIDFTFFGWCCCSHTSSHISHTSSHTVTVIVVVLVSRRYIDCMDSRLMFQYRNRQTAQFTVCCLQTRFIRWLCIWGNKSLREYTRRSQHPATIPIALIFLFAFDIKDNIFWCLWILMASPAPAKCQF